MLTRWCPRCHETRSISMFQDPVSMCLACYGRIPSNRGLSLDQLIDKAQASTFARRRFAKEDSKAFAQALQRQVLSKKEVSQETKDLLEKMPCDYCEKDYDYNDQNIIGLIHFGENKLCCRGCLPTALATGAVVIQNTQKAVYVDSESIGARVLKLTAKKKSND